jgi:hypothetical protein
MTLNFKDAWLIFDRWRQERVSLMRRSFLIASGLALTLACSDLGPEDLLGMWWLRTLNGSSVPGSVVVNQPDGGTETLDVGTLWFRLDPIGPEDLGECTYHQEVDGNVEELACEWHFTPSDNAVVLRFGDQFPNRFVLAGTASDGAITFTDIVGNILVFGR